MQRAAETRQCLHLAHNFRRFFQNRRMKRLGAAIQNKRGRAGPVLSLGHAANAIGIQGWIRSSEGYPEKIREPIGTEGGVVHNRHQGEGFPPRPGGQNLGQGLHVRALFAEACRMNRSSDGQHPPIHNTYFPESRRQLWRIPQFHSKISPFFSRSGPDQLGSLIQSPPAVVKRIAIVRRQEV